MTSSLTEGLNVSGLHAARNTEMNSDNGKIDTPWDATEGRVKYHNVCTVRFWNNETIEANVAPMDNQSVRDLVTHSPTLYFSRGVSNAHIAFTNHGTLHQYFAEGDSDVSRAEDSSTNVEDDEPPAERLGSHVTPPKGTATKSSTRSVAPSAVRTDVAGLLGAAPRKKGAELAESQQRKQSYLQRIASASWVPVEKRQFRAYLPEPNLVPHPEWIRLNHRLKWAGVAIQPNGYRCMKLTGLCAQTIDAAAAAPQLPDFSDSDDDDCVPAFRRGLPLMATAVRRALGVELHDYRSLALKIDLYDELRERRILQPTGVDYAWVPPVVKDSQIVTLDSVGQWSYEAIFVTLEVLEWSLYRGGSIPVEQANCGFEWLLSSGSVKVITLDEKPGSQLERDCWIVSHLTYPLGMVFDIHDVHQIGEEEHKKDVYFARTAGLVDIYEGASRIIFVLPSYFVGSVTLASTAYNVVTTNYRGGVPNGVRIPVYNVNPTIAAIVTQLLTEYRSLRSAFSRYIEAYAPKGIDWLEINSISVALTVRWHQKVETYAVREQEQWVKKSRGAPARVLEHLGLIPDPIVTDLSYPDYGGSAAVGSMDQRFVERSEARSSAMVSLGMWTNMADIALAAGFAILDTYNVENPLQVAARERSGGLDRLMRGSFLRRAFEEWKKAAAQEDGIAFPHVNSIAGGYWGSLIDDVRGDGTGCTTTWFAQQFITKQVGWYWNMNYKEDLVASTLTGVRTPSSWWRTTDNTAWGGYSIAQEAPENDGVYLFEDSERVWQGDSYCQIGTGEDAPRLQKALMRVDLEKIDMYDWGFAYQSHPGFNVVAGLRWAVDYSAGGIKARDIGWVGHGHMVTPAEDKWGWGLAIRIKDYAEQTLKTLVIPAKTAMTMSTGYYSEGTVLLRSYKEGDGLQTTAVLMGSQVGYSVGIFGRGRKYASNPKEGGAPSASLPDSIRELEEKLTRLKATSQEHTFTK